MYIYESNKYSWRKKVNRKYKIQNLFKTKTRQQLNNYQPQDQIRGGILLCLIVRLLSIDMKITVSNN